MDSVVSKKALLMVVASLLLSCSGASSTSPALSHGQDNDHQTAKPDRLGFEDNQILPHDGGPAAADGGEPYYCDAGIREVNQPEDSAEFKKLRDDPRRYQTGRLWKCPGITVEGRVKRLRQRLREIEEAESASAVDGGN